MAGIWSPCLRSAESAGIATPQIDPGVPTGSRASFTVSDPPPTVWAGVGTGPPPDRFGRGPHGLPWAVSVR
jgi:hypothetical protein